MYLSFFLFGSTNCWYYCQCIFIMQYASAILNVYFLFDKYNKILLFWLFLCRCSINFGHMDDISVRCVVLSVNAVIAIIFVWHSHIARSIFRYSSVEHRVAVDSLLLKWKSALFFCKQVFWDSINQHQQFAHQLDGFQLIFLGVDCVIAYTIPLMCAWLLAYGPNDCWKIMELAVG